MPIFISYSHKDKDFVDKLAIQLARQNIHVWLDRWELSVGDSLVERVQEAVDGASALLVILSKASTASVKVLDFGLVKTAEPGELELTAAHATMGTPLYMSPEAAKGADTVTPPSDIYSLGAVGYELLTGQTVFSGLSLGEIIFQQLKSKPDKPSERLKRPVSPDLENLLSGVWRKAPRHGPRPRNWKRG